MPDQPRDTVTAPDRPDLAPDRPDLAPERARVHRVRDAYLRMRARAYATPLGRLGVKIAVAVVGTLVIAVGVVLLPLPGPGWVVILAGLALLAMEFAWARRLLGFTRAQLLRWTRLVREGSWLVRIASVGGLLLVVGGALLLSLRILA
ncbi:TIGR02611 family protein [Dactylosporangium sp. CA-052675]|uniref:TIGR02611 family protein n=1 Tax=Dactylosporangium sp. CA-052675 TaxID=3239927 RepID=UPI003D8E1495